MNLMIRTVLDSTTLDRLRLVLRHAEQTRDLERTLSDAKSIRWRKPIITRIGTAYPNRDYSIWTMPITVYRGEVVRNSGKPCMFEYEVHVKFNDNAGSERARKILQAAVGRMTKRIARPDRQTADR